MTDERLKETEKYFGGRFTLDADYARELIAHIREERKREERLEDVARRYELWSTAASCDGWVASTIGEAQVVPVGHDVYPTRRSCDSAILEAVAAYEKEGGK